MQILITNCFDNVLFFSQELSNDEQQRMETFIGIFDNIPNLDLIQIKTNLDFFSQQYMHSESLEKLRYLLKKVLLTEILKCDHVDKEIYQTCLEETNSMLGIGQETGYSCFLVGCKFWGVRHRNYIIHIKRHHPTSNSIPCNFKKTCKQNFSSVDALIMHLKVSHSSLPVQDASSHPVGSGIDTECKCSRISCGGLKFSNTKQLMIHYNSYHSNEYRQCIFNECRTWFHAACPTSAMNHFRIKHKKTGNYSLKSSYLVMDGMISAEPSTSTPPEQQEDHVEVDHDVLDQLYDVTDLDTLEDFDIVPGDEEASEMYYLQYYGDYLNRLCHCKYIPQTTIQEIVKESIVNQRKTLERQKKNLRKSLQGKVLEPVEVDEIEKNIFDDDPFLKAQLQLNTEYKRTKFVQECDTYVGPQEIVLNRANVLLGARKDCFHYSSVVDSFKILIQDESFCKMKGNVTVSNNDSEKLQDIKDGSHYKTNEFFRNNPEAYTMVLYSDAIEIKNALGAARGSYKVVQVFYTLGEIEKSQRSKVDRLTLVMIFREKLLKKYSLNSILKPLVEDLKKLEIGVEIKIPETRMVKCGLLAYTADNLEASLVGGFSSNFSSRDICRICHIQYNQLEDEICDDHGSWTQDEYNSIFAQRTAGMEVDEENLEASSELDSDNIFAGRATEDETGDDSGDDDSDSDGDDSDGDDVSDLDEEEELPSRGLNMECSFNVLDSFHCVTSFPLDLMHDLFEGKTSLYVIVFSLVLFLFNH